MTCPKCGHEQPDVFTQCQQCRFIFPTQPHKTQQTATAVQTPFAPIQGGPSIPAFFGALAGAIVLILAIWWLFTPEGLPLPDGAYVNEKHHFAMSVPKGWVILTADNYQEMFQKLGDRLPKGLQEGLSHRRTEVGFLKLMEDADFSPNINVVVIEGDVPPLDESQIEEASNALTAEFSRVLDSYKLEKSELVTVDELNSLKFSSRGQLKFRVSNQQAQNSADEWKTYDLRITQTLVPGRKKAYIVTCTAEALRSQDSKRDFEDAVDSFRVLQRPARFGPIVMGGLQGGLIAALGYLLYYLITALVAIIRR